MLEQALRMAEALGDERLLGEVLMQRATCHWGLMTARGWAEDGGRGEQLLRKIGDRWNWVNVAATWKVGLACAGRLTEAVEDLDEYQKTADRLGHTMARAAIGVARGFSAFQRTGDIDQFREFAEWYRDFNHRIDYPWEFVAWGHLGLCDFWQGEWERSLESFEQALRIETERPSALYGWGNYYMVLCYTDASRAEELFASKRGSFPVGEEGNGGGAWVALMRGIEGHASRGAARTCGRALSVGAAGRVNAFETT